MHHHPPNQERAINLSILPCHGQVPTLPRHSKVTTHFHVTASQPHPLLSRPDPKTFLSQPGNPTLSHCKKKCNEIYIFKIYTHFLYKATIVFFFRFSNMFGTETLYNSTLNRDPYYKIQTYLVFGFNFLTGDIFISYIHLVINLRTKAFNYAHFFFILNFLYTLVHFNERVIIRIKA